MSRTIPVGWAVVSKPAGTKSDYSVRAMSRELCSDAVIRELVLARSPGNPPVVHEQGPSALPWAWFVQPLIRDKRYLSIVIREWTDRIDGTNRPIANNLFVCVELDEFIDSGCGFADLYAAAQRLTLAIDPVNPSASEPADLELTGTAPAIGSWRTSQAILDAAAALPETPVTLINGPTELIDRLAVFDAIAQLLPGGARRWISASSWADVAVNRLPLLIFAQRGRGGDTVIDLESARPTPLSPAARSYRDLFDTLRAEHTEPTVLDHLRRQSGMRDRDPVTVAMALADLDLVSIVAAKAERGHVDVSEVRRLGQQDRFGDLSDDQLTSVVTGYLKVALAEDLVADRELIGAYLYRDQDGFADALLRLLEEKPTARSLSELAAVTRSVDLAHMLGDALRRAHNTDQRLFDSTELGQAVVALIEQEYWTTALAPLVAAIPGFARVAARPAFFTRGQGGQWVAQVNAVAGPESPWSKLRASLDAGAGVTPTGPALQDLWQIDPELVRELLARATLHDSAIVEPLLDRVVSILLNSKTEVPSALLEQLSDALVTDPDRQARIDFILYRKQARPKQGFSEPSDTYRTRLIDLVVTTPMTPSERAGVIVAIAARLCLRWSARNAQSTLDGLWTLSHLTKTDASAKSAVTRAIEVENQATNGQLSGLLQPSPWQRELSAAGTMSPEIATQRIRSLGPKASVPDLAVAIAQASNAGVSSKDLVAVLRSTSWQGPDVLGWFELANFVTAELVGRKFARPYEPGAFLITAWVDGEFGQPSEHNLRGLADHVKAQTELSKRMAEALSSNDSRWGKLISETVKGPFGRNKADKKHRGERDDFIEQ
ncbi:hypothetical protein [Nocardia alba]|uniref:Uncharacterized protein n=1 Tax=Nocardia alba TaxID=225051 RepID=A0A4R1FVC4_9NOCA|nr:hypothetical protein [Nocardia alba]TCJ97709.1 hypothetical protein DFR71_3757 [Nocardia alba]